MMLALKKTKVLSKGFLQRKCSYSAKDTGNHYNLRGENYWGTFWGQMGKCVETKYKIEANTFLFNLAAWVRWWWQLASFVSFFNLQPDHHHQTSQKHYHPISHILIVYSRSGTNKSSFWGKYVPSVTYNTPIFPPSPPWYIFSITACVLTLTLFAHWPLHNPSQ